MTRAMGLFSKIDMDGIIEDVNRAENQLRKLSRYLRLWQMPIGTKMRENTAKMLDLQRKKILSLLSHIKLDYDKKQQRAFSDYTQHLDGMLAYVNTMDPRNPDKIFCSTCLRQKNVCSCGSLFMEDILLETNLRNSALYQRVAVIMDSNTTILKNIVEVVSAIDAIPEISDKYLEELKQQFYATYSGGHVSLEPVVFSNEVNRIISAVENLHIILADYGDDDALYSIQSEQNCLSCLILSEKEPKSLHRLDLIPHPKCGSGYCSCRYVLSPPKPRRVTVKPLDYVDDVLKFIDRFTPPIELLMMLQTLKISYVSLMKIIKYLGSDSIRIDGDNLRVDGEFEDVIAEIVHRAQKNNKLLLLEKVLDLFGDSINESDLGENQLLLLEKRLEEFVARNELIAAQETMNEILELGKHMPKQAVYDLHNRLLNRYIELSMAEQSNRQNQRLLDLGLIDSEEFERNRHKIYNTIIGYYMTENKYNQALFLLDQMHNLDIISYQEYMEKFKGIKTQELVYEVGFYRDSDQDFMRNIRLSLEAYQKTERKLQAAIANGAKAEIKRLLKTIVYDLHYVPEVNFKFWDSYLENL